MFLLFVLACCVGQQNPPTWPNSVNVFSPADPYAGIQKIVDNAFALNGGRDPQDHGQFSSQRFAFLFAPGKYNVEVPVGYYTHVLGLGQSPDDVVFTSEKGVYAEMGGHAPSTGSLNTFWRAAENFRTQSNFDWKVGKGMLWAVSQAAPVRRVHVDNDLNLFEVIENEGAGYASGGYFSNCLVGGKGVCGSQQQWFCRNSELGNGWSNGVWNQVFVGVTGAPDNHCSNVGGQPYTVVPETPRIAEKPFISIGTDGKYTLNVPMMRTNSTGTDWSTGIRIPFENVYVARNASDTAASINKKLAAGLHIIMTPGEYGLEETLMINITGQIIMGLGFPTMVSLSGAPVITVGPVDDVRLVGPFLIQAGTKPTHTLVEWGPEGGYHGKENHPGFMYDVFVRVGGPNGAVEVQADTMVHVTSNHVIGDNMWLWRADHDSEGIVKDSKNPCKNGLVVDGTDVTMFGLAVEHTLEDGVVWNGESGQTYFYQCELPYDVSQENFGDKNYVGYRVASSVSTHSGYGIGIYSFMRDHAVTVLRGISVPPAVLSSFVAPFSVFLNGNGTIVYVINNEGAATSPSNPGQPEYVCA